MRQLIHLLILSIIPAFCQAGVLKVPSQYLTIQSAINAANDRDLVLVAPGIYVENINFKGKAIAVRSEKGPELTTIDGGKPVNPDFKSVVIFKNGEESDSVLDGFTIKNGAGSRISVNAYLGGGIHCTGKSSPTIINNIITDNKVPNSGGGIACMYSSSPTIKGNIIKGNECGSHGGGGIYNYQSSPQIIGNQIIENIASQNNYGDGGGIHFFHCNNTPMVANNLIARNIAGWGGGGIYSESSSPQIIHNQIIDNTTTGLYGSGGGLYFSYCDYSPLVENNLIAGNTAETTGGGFYIQNDPGPMIINNIITKNSAQTKGGGIYNNSSHPLITNNTITKNMADMGGGLRFAKDCSKGNITNTIIWDNQAQTSPEISINGIMPEVSYCNIKGSWPGIGNINAGPLFVNGTSDDYHLTFSSPCKDSGDNNAPGLTQEDFEYDPRIASGIVDMGADEFHTHLYYTGNATPGGNIELKFIDTPNTAPVIFWLGSGVLNTPLSLPPHGDWHLQFPILFEAILGSIPSPDGVLLLNGVIPLTMPAPIDLPLQAGIGTKFTNLIELKIK